MPSPREVRADFDSVYKALLQIKNFYPIAGELPCPYPTTPLVARVCTSGHCPPGPDAWLNPIHHFFFMHFYTRPFSLRCARLLMNHLAAFHLV